MTNRCRVFACVALTAFAAAAAAGGAEVFVSPEGDDANAGTIEKPFATVQRAQEAVAPGDTVYIRGGRCVLTEKQIARQRGIFADVTHLDKSGAEGGRINYFASGDERPVFDLSQVKPPLRVNAFYIAGSWIHIRGLEVVGVQVTLTGHTQSICFANDGSHNILERLSMHDGQAIGIYSVRGSHNLYLNCDAYNNYDFTSQNGRGGNVDGFGSHGRKGDVGNVFRGCRAWFNSDDGFDCINAHEPVTFENCWAFYNGFTPDFQSRGDGNGFKAGGYGATPAERLPQPIPRHVVRFCLAVRNKANGFYANHHPGGIDWFSNTGYRNAGADFNMLCRLADNRTDVDGYDHKLRNNLAHKGRAAVTRFDRAKNDASHNSFDLAGTQVSEADFLSTDEAELTRPRRANGDLPAIRFLHPAEGSVLIDKGEDIGFVFGGAAPDLGSFEKR